MPFFDIAACFGKNLLRQRKAAGISQDELATMASLHRTEVSQLERGLRIARIDTLVKLAASLECETAELLAGIAWRPGTTRYGSFAPREEAKPS